MNRDRKSKILRFIVSLVFIFFLAFPSLLTSPSFTTVTGSRESSRRSALSEFGFYLEEVSDQSGVSFMHHMPRLDPKIDPVLPLVASMGASVSVADFDRDGWNDFYVTDSRFGTKNRLYRNLKNGSFMDVAEAMGIADLNKEGTGVCMGSVWADFDNDGYEDLFVYKWGRPELFRNERGERFVRITENSGLPSWINANSAIWLDFNSDGLADLFIGGYFPDNLDLWHLKNTNILTESFEYAQNGGRNFLLMNTGKGIFRGVSREAGLTSTRWTLAAGSADIDRDGYPELIVANEYGTDEFYRNEKGRRFVEESKNTMIGFAPKSGMNVSFGDIHNKGQFGIYISNITEEGVLLQGNNFWVPAGDEGRKLYINAARQSGIEAGGWCYGAQFGDLNNDGNADLYVANGFISGRKKTSYWYDYSKITGGNASIIADVKNWPDLDGRSLSGYQRNKIWVNNGSGYFRDAAGHVAGSEDFDSRAVALADLWNRGVLDVIVANQNGNLQVYRNRVNPENHWISFELEGARCNRSAIGAIIDLYWNSKNQCQVVTGGIGFSSQNQRALHFGLGKDPKIDRVEILWPGGRQQILENPGIDQKHLIMESR